MDTHSSPMSARYGWSVVGSEPDLLSSCFMECYVMWSFLEWPQTHPYFFLSERYLCFVCQNLPQISLIVNKYLTDLIVLQLEASYYGLLKNNTFKWNYWKWIKYFSLEKAWHEYRKLSNIRCTKSQNLNIYRLLLHLSAQSIETSY